MSVVITELPPEKSAGLSSAFASTGSDDQLLLAQFLHDHVCSHLAVMKMQLSRIGAHSKTKLQKRDLDSLERELDGLIASIRTASRSAQLSAESLLHSAMGDYLNKFQRRTGIKATFNATGSDTDISSEVTVAVCAILKEALANVVRHAKAKAVYVKASRRGTFLLVSIRDDGMGIRKSRRAHGGFGLFSMKQRVYKFGGTVDFRPGPDCGFEVVVRIPLLGAVSSRVRASASLSGSIAS